MEDHSVVVRALCERIRKLEEQNLKLKTRIDELNSLIEAIDDGARYVTVEAATMRPTLNIVSDSDAPASESESTVVAPEPKTAGRPKKDGGNDKERERKRRWYEKKKLAKAAKAESKTELTSSAK